MLITKEARRIARLVNTTEFITGLGGDDLPEDREDLDNVIFNFLDEMDAMHKMKNVTNKDRLKKEYLETIPRDWPFLAEDCYKVQMTLMRLYFILGREGLIEQKDAENMVLFLQGLQDIFLRNFQDISRYSPDKQQYYTLTQATFKDFRDLPGFDDLSELFDAFPLEDMEAIDDDDYEDYFAYQIRVDLEGFKPPVWRRLIIPATISYLDLHRILQAAFDWEDSHLWHFDVNGETIDAEEAPSIPIDDDMETLDTITYIYDYGDDWVHKIKIEKMLDDERYMQNGPELVKAVGDTPQEDSRGQDAWIPLDMKRLKKKLAGVWKEIGEGEF